MRSWAAQVDVDVDVAAAHANMNRMSSCCWVEQNAMLQRKMLMLLRLHHQNDNIFLVMICLVGIIYHWLTNFYWQKYLPQLLHPLLESIFASKNFPFSRKILPHKSLIFNDFSPHCSFFHFVQMLILLKFSIIVSIFS